jgi:enediyne biosynthesis protein E4
MSPLTGVDCVRRITSCAWRPVLLCLLAPLALAVVSCQQQEKPANENEITAQEVPVIHGPPIFADVTAATDVRFTYQNDEEKGYYAILESLGGGIALIDFDGDGLLDIFIPGGGYYGGKDGKEIKGYPPRLYKNLGNFKFRDVTKEAGLDRPQMYSHGAAVLDYDRDGWPDLLVTGYGRLTLYHNEPDGNGGRIFRDVTQEVGLLIDRHFWSTSAACGDLDGSGYPSIYVCQYVNWSWDNNPRCPGYSAKADRDVCPPKQFKSVPHALYRNTGKGRFVDVTKEANIRIQRDDGDYGKGLGVVMADLDDDGRPDIYVANDTTDNFLYLNRTKKPGAIRFDDVGVPMFVAKDDRGVSNGSMGVDVGDENASGLPSIWVTNYENELHALYRNKMQNGRQHFLYSTRVSGIAAIGQSYVGWGTCFLDSDNQGWLDIFVSNGHVVRHPGGAPLAQEPVFLRNVGGGRYKKYRQDNDDKDSYLLKPHRGRGLAVGDLNNDGLPDLVISHLNEPVTILRNVSGAKNHWLGVELRGKDNRDVVGAKLVLEVNGQKLTRFAKSGCSYASSFDPRHLFGLGQNDKVGRLTVYWPWLESRAEHFDGLTIDRYHRVVEGTGKKE